MERVSTGRSGLIWGVKGQGWAGLGVWSRGQVGVEGSGGGLPSPPRAPPEHQNFVGEDGRLGPVAVSLRREEKELPGGGPPLTLHRLIIRTSQVGLGGSWAGNGQRRGSWGPWGGV